MKELSKYKLFPHKYFEIKNFRNKAVRNYRLTRKMHSFGGKSVIFNC